MEKEEMKVKEKVNNSLSDFARHPIVGIDLGTTNSAVAYIHLGKPEIILSPDGDKLIPSVVHIDQKQRVTVGEDARAALVAMPSRTVAAVKRKMGSGEKIKLAEQEYLPQEISALILKELKSYVDGQLGEGMKEAVITVPAYFTDEQRRATKQAGEMAGFVVERIINEPTAAAMAFGLANLAEDRRILVYDLGGGTFDVSIVEMMSGILEVQASAGNNQLGGEDFDWLLVNWLSRQIQEEHGVDPLQDLRAKALLKEKAEIVKKELSKEEQVEVILPLVTVKENQPVGLNKMVTRKQFEQLIDGLLTETMTKVKEVLEEAGLQPKDIDEVLLVGGSTRIPQVRQLLQEFFHKEPRRDINPDEAVALGAAVQAGLKAGLLSDSGMVVTDVAPFSMGVAALKEWQGRTVRPGGFSVIIPKNTTIPVTRAEQFTTVFDRQDKVSIQVYQGEHEWVKHNHLLGEFLLEGVPTNRAGQEIIEVSFHYNLNGILEVAAICLSNKKKMGITVQDGLNRLSQQELAESMTKLEALWQGATDEGDDDDLDWDEQLDLDLDMDEAGWPKRPSASLDDLKEEAKLLIKQGKDLLERDDQKSSHQLRRCLDKLQEALAGDDQEHLSQVVDEMLDLLVDLETEED
jgi:molecular chaperone DnaK